MGYVINRIGPTSDGRACVVTASCEGVHGFNFPPEHNGELIYHDTHNNNINNNNNTNSCIIR